MTGTVTIDTTTGIAAALNITFTGVENTRFDSADLTTYYQGEPGFPSETLGDITAGPNPLPGNYHYLSLLIPLPTFVGYTGGPMYLGTLTEAVHSELVLPSGTTVFASGSFTAAVPEPSSFDLLGLGGIGLAISTIRRR